MGKLGIEVAKSTIEKYRIRSSKPPSPMWRSFLKNHVADLVSIDFFTIPTINFKVLFVLVVLSHHRRKVIHFNVTENPTAQWAAQQMVEAFPRGVALRNICFGIATRYMEKHFAGALRVWASNKF